MHWLEDQVTFRGLAITGRKGPRPAPYDEYHDGGITKSNLEFRRFLHAGTQIGLELIQADREAARRLAAGYRLNIAPDVYRGRASARSHFLGPFQSTCAYSELSQTEQRELWDGFDYWHKRMDRGDAACEDWAHMFLNLVLPGDWMVMSKLRAWFHPPTHVHRPLRDSLCSQWGIQWQ